MTHYRIPQRADQALQETCRIRFDTWRSRGDSLMSTRPNGQRRKIIGSTDENPRTIKHNYMGREPIPLGLIDQGEGIASKHCNHWGSPVSMCSTRAGRAPYRRRPAGTAAARTIHPTSHDGAGAVAADATATAWPAPRHSRANSELPTEPFSQRTRPACRLTAVGQRRRRPAAATAGHRSTPFRHRRSSGIPAGFATKPRIRYRASGSFCTELPPASDDDQTTTEGPQSCALRKKASRGYDGPAVQKADDDLL